MTRINKREKNGGAMHAKATKANTPRRWRPLSQAQLNAIECLLAGMNDTETAADPRVNIFRVVYQTC